MTRISRNESARRRAKSAGLPNIAIVLAGALTAGPAAAQVVELEGIVLSGGLTPVQEANFGRSVNVITSEQIEQRGIRELGDALRQVPGLSVSRAGGAGGLTEIRIRGAEANHVLVLIDGIETANSSGNFNFGDLTADEIERIEVIRGPSSALFGSAALAGIINIVTKRGIRNGYRAGATVEAGTAPSKAFSGLIRGGGSNIDIAASLSRRDDDGWNPAGEGGEDDGFENTTFSTKVTADLTRALELQGVFRWTNRESDFDATAFGCGTPACYVTDADNVTTGRDRIFGLSATYKMFDGALEHQPFVHFADSENTNNASGFIDENDASTFKYGYKGVYHFGASRDHSLAGLAEYKEETFNSDFATSEKKRDQVSFAAEYKGFVLPNLFVQGGIRHDNNEAFDDALTWTASASYLVEPTQTRFHGSVGKGVVNPTFFEQFGTRFGTFIGNPNLTPEESLGWDAGIEQKLFNGNLIVDVTYFQATLTDEIRTTFLPTFESTVINLDGESDRQGVEVQATMTPLPGLFVTASYTYLDATEPDGTVETRRPKNMAGLNVSYTFFDGKAQVGADVTYNADRTQSNFSDPSFTSPKIPLDDFVVVDLNASYRLSDDIKVYGTFNNVFDEDYQEILGYDARPQQAYFGVKVGY